jgi:hypothetical protein
MPKRQPKETSKPVDVFQRLRQSLTKCPKNQLVDLLVELAESDRGTLRRLAAQIELQSPPEELAATTRQAIADATRFNPRDINRNFHYDGEAYAEVKRNLSRLTGEGQLRLAMELSLELMKQGSCQVEASDEGLMTEDIEECLGVVVAALKHCDLPPAQVVAWCRQMQKCDCVGFICDEELVELRERFEASESQ